MVAPIVFITPVNVSPGVTGSYQDVDVSAYVAAGSTGVVLCIYASTTKRQIKFRMNGSTQDITTRYVGYNTVSGGCYYFCGLDANLKLEVYIANADTLVYLVGYCTNVFTFPTDIVSKSTATTGSYVDVDVTADGSKPASCMGVVVELHHTGGKTQYAGTVRRNGSTDDFYYLLPIQYSNTYVVAVDADEIFEQKIANAEVDCYVVAYITTDSQIILNTNATTKDLSETTTFTDLDLTTETDAAATGLFGVIYRTADGTINASYIRKNGYTLTCPQFLGVTNGELWQSSFITECDAGQVVEIRSYGGTPTYKLLVMGYIKPTAVGAPSNPQGSGVVNAMLALLGKMIE